MRYDDVAIGDAIADLPWPEAFAVPAPAAPTRTLAIHGGRPAFDREIHVGAPNVGDPQRYLQLLDGMLRRKRFSNNGPLVQDFEARVAEYVGARHVVAVCNGTIALEIALRASGATGEVIVPSYTFVATAHAVHWQGLTPVFADIDPATHCLDPAAVAAKITPRTSAIVATHLWGRPAPVRALEAIAEAHGLRLIFDAAHAFGVSHRGRMIGNFGTCEVFSFHATKFLNSLEGGAIVTNDDALAATARLMRNFGFEGYDRVVHPGTNGKMVEACAAMGLANLESIDGFIACNRRHHETYRRAIDPIPGLTLLDMPEHEAGNYQYVVVMVDARFGASRDAVVEALWAENVLVRKYFWPGCHRMQPYRDLFPDAGASLGQTEAVAGRVLVLPTGTAVTQAEIETIVDLIRAVGEHGARGSMQ